ncbi:uncharacterized protein [Onthophagus taurus]|uniref:uncharacterized protein isoform X2 n=1 Tax=Onthophagus taurus TaxID=166361 RepID=UPI0039BEC156
METRSRFHWPLLLFGLLYLTSSLQVVQGVVESGPSESECRPFIEKALKELEIGAESSSAVVDDDDSSKEDIATVEITTEDDDSLQHEGESEPTVELEDDADAKSAEDQKEEEQDGSEETDGSLEEATPRSGEDQQSDEDAHSHEIHAGDAPEATDDGSEEDQGEDRETDHDGDQEDATSASVEEPTEGSDEKETEDEDKSTETASAEEAETSKEDETGTVKESEEDQETQESIEEEKKESQESVEEVEEEQKMGEAESAEKEEKDESTEVQDKEESVEDAKESAEDTKDSVEDTKESAEDVKESVEDIKESVEDAKESAEDTKESVEDTKESVEDTKESAEDVKESVDDTKDSVEDTKDSVEDTKDSVEDTKESIEEMQGDQPQEAQIEEKTETPITEEKEEPKKLDIQESEIKDLGEKDEESEEKEEAPEEELIIEDEKPDELRPTEHLAQLLKLDDEYEEKERIIDNIAEITLRDLKRLYENAIKPLETLYKYRDLSNRHFGDAEIFAKPLVLFMGPWSGGKSSIINYLVDNEYNETSLRTGAEPSPAYFNIMMHGQEPEVLDGTQLAADFTFSGLQKFGQGLEERLRGMKLPKKLLEKVNIVEIPGILEVRKQISRVFPFNDACQWFIDRADIIFLVYDPSKLDVGPETEAILDQLKGREHQTRIILNKADQVKPEELMRVQGALIWNISPLMSSAQPPAMYTTSLWSRPYEPWAPVRLLQAQERAFLRDLRTAIDKRIENRIASARRFAVRVRNHAKMVDCYLTTYYNHKSVFGNRKQVSDAIIEHPQDYHIYEGLSTLTNISRYDLPDPDVYRDFFRLNPLYDFQQLSATCTYFRGCPINRLDVAIAYDLPELVGKHKKMVEEAVARANSKTPAS